MNKLAFFYIYLLCCIILPNENTLQIGLQIKLRRNDKTVKAAVVAADFLRFATSFSNEDVLKNMKKSYEGKVLYEKIVENNLVAGMNYGKSKLVEVRDFESEATKFVIAFGGSEDIQQEFGNTYTGANRPINFEQLKEKLSHSTAGEELKVVVADKHKIKIISFEPETDDGVLGKVSTDSCRSGKCARGFGAQEALNALGDFSNRPELTVDEVKGKLVNSFGAGYEVHNESPPFFISKNFDAIILTEEGEIFHIEHKEMVTEQFSKNVEGIPQDLKFKFKGAAHADTDVPLIDSEGNGASGSNRIIGRGHSLVSSEHQFINGKVLNKAAIGGMTGGGMVGAIGASAAKGALPTSRKILQDAAFYRQAAAEERISGSAIEEAAANVAHVEGAPIEVAAIGEGAGTAAETGIITGEGVIPVAGEIVANAAAGEVAAVAGEGIVAGAIEGAAVGGTAAFAAEEAGVLGFCAFLGATGFGMALGAAIGITFAVGVLIYEGIHSPQNSTIPSTVNKTNTEF